MNNTKYENLCNDWCHSCIGQLHKSHWTPPRRQSFTREVAASHLVSPSRLQVARQSYILQVRHIHLCDCHKERCQSVMGSFTPNAHRATAYKHINPGILNTVLECENFALLNSAIVTN